jgi:hypothetical protein
MDQLARDCAGLIFDLERRAVPKLSAAIGMSPHELLDAVRATNPEAVADPEQRQQLLDLQALAGVDGVSEAITTFTKPVRQSGTSPEARE